MPPPIIEPSDPPQPRLGIAHILMWMLASGLILAGMRMVPAPANNAQQLLFVIWEACYAASSGAALGGVMLYLWRLLRAGPKFPTAPGHWLLLIFGWRTVLDWGSYFGVLLWHHNAGEAWAGPTTPTLMFLLALTPQYLIMLLMWLAATSACARPSMWETSFGVMVMQEAICLGGGFLLICGGLMEDDLGRETISIWFWLINRAQLLGIGSFYVLLATWQDWDRRESRDWLHWTGVAVCLGSTALAWAWMLLSGEM